eukprot:360433-Chlamydomonas_euryale.AAC.6
MPSVWPRSAMKGLVWLRADEHMGIAAGLGYLAGESWSLGILKHQQNPSAAVGIYRCLIDCLVSPQPCQQGPDAYPTDAWRPSWPVIAQEAHATPGQPGVPATRDAQARKN